MSRALAYSIAGAFVAIGTILVVVNTPSLRKTENSPLQEVVSPKSQSLATTPPHSTHALPQISKTANPVLTPTSPSPVTSVVTTMVIASTSPPVAPKRVLFGNGVPFLAGDLPPSPLRAELEALPPNILTLALERLTQMTFHINDLNSLHVDQTGMPYYICTFTNTDSPNNTNALPSTARTAANIPVPATDPSASALASPTPAPGILVADVPITSPPIRHSRPGAPRVLFLDFSGHVITNTVWNSSYAIPRWDCRPFDTDGNTNTFSASEQTYIIQMWERVSEDYAPFDIDVTTEQPTNWTSTTGHALITPDTDANGLHCPHYGSGGIAYVNVFGLANYSHNAASCYSPAFVLPMYDYSYANTAEAISHELGHNMGLSHDGYVVPPTTNEYYGGHGTGDISWGPIMGTGYSRNVSQWSKGEYYGANNPEDDLAKIAAKAPYRTDDHGHTAASSTLLTASNGATIIASGIISSNTDVDMFSFVSGIGAISITAFPYRCASGTYGGNLDIFARLFDSNGSLVASDNPSNATQAIINYTSPMAGKYYLSISNSGAGDPANAVPTGYTAYGSIGQYFITGTVPLATGLLVQTPNSGELWYKGQTNTIRWSSGTNVGQNVKIELYLNGSHYSTIADNVTNNGAYAWNTAPPILSSTNYLIHLSSVTQTNVWDESDTAFTITMAPSTSLFFENFDATNTLPAGWTQTNLSGITTWKFQNGGWTGGLHPSTAYSGARNACLEDNTSSSDINRLMTPTINMAGCTGAVLRFWHYMEQWTPDQDFLNIWVKTNNAAQWVWLAGYSNSVSSWTQRTLTLPNPSTNYVIGFAGDAKYGYGVCLDDVEVIGYPTDISVATNNTPLQWLADFHLEPTDAGALSDTDHDGMKAWEEWVAGTCPTQSSSVLKVSNSWNGFNGRILQWPIVTGRVYLVTWSSNLTTTAFQALATSNTVGIYTDTVHAADQSGFYRIGVEMSP